MYLSQMTPIYLSRNSLSNCSVIWWLNPELMPVMSQVRMS